MSILVGGLIISTGLLGLLAYWQQQQIAALRTQVEEIAEWQGKLVWRIEKRVLPPTDLPQ